MESYPLYAINTGTIIIYLMDDQQKWKKYNRQFLEDTVQDAIQLVLWNRDIISVQYNGENGEYLNGYKKTIYPADLKSSENPDNFPFPDYFLRPDKNSNYYNLIEYATPCLIKKADANFDLFFALQFSLTDIVDGEELPASEFLQYHLKNTFDNDIPAFRYYLDNLCLKYADFLTETYRILIRQFFDRIGILDKAEKQTEAASEKEKLKWLGTPSQFGYIFSELAKAGFIELPSTKGAGSYAKYAQTSWGMFDFETPTTIGNLEKEMNPEKNTLSIFNKNKFTIPEKSEISTKKKKMK